MSVYYKIYTERYTFYAQHVQTDPSDTNNRTRGGTATFDLQIQKQPDDNLTISSGSSKTISSGETVAVQDLVVEDNATLTINGTLTAHGTVNNSGTINTQDGTLNVLGRPPNAFAKLLEYDRHAGSYSLESTLDNTQRYKERLPTSPNVQSLVVGLEPATELQNDDIEGKWGLISNVTDSRTRATTNNVITVEIDILADFVEYSDVNSVQTDLAI